MANTLPNRSISSDFDRVRWGGGWINSASSVRAGYRYNNSSDARYDYVGFRPVFVAHEFLTAAVPAAPPAATAAPAAPAAPTAPTPPDREIVADSFRKRNGGSWLNDRHRHQVDYSISSAPDERYFNFGFRPAIFHSTAFDQLSAAAPAAPAAPVQSAPPDRDASSDALRVIRGGGWLNIPSFFRAGDRSSGVPGYRSYRVGFRPVFIADEFIGVNVPMAQTARAAQAAQAAPAAPAPRAPAPPAPRPTPPPAPPAPPAPPPVPPVPQMTNIVTSSNYKKLYLTRSTAQFNIDPAVRMSILNSRSFRAAGVRFIGRNEFMHYFGSMIMPIHDQDNYFYLLDLVGKKVDYTTGYEENYGPTIFGWLGADIPILKTGSVERRTMVYRGDDYIRAHSPGSKSFMPGLGTNVYAAGAILAAFMGKDGIYSTKYSRSSLAEDFWKRAVATGFAAEQGQQEFISAEKVLKSPLYVRYPGMETEFSVGSQTKAYFTTAYPFSSQPPDFAYDGKTYMSVSKTFKATPAVRKLRAEMLARSAFAISSDSVQRVYSLLQDIGIQSEMDLFRSRPEVNGTQGLAGLRHKRLPPLSGESQQLLNGISNPY